ncbi:MAG: alpha-glucan family phosphorylase [Bacteroidetes bacterium]|jgi:phosphorylase/glycogen(starch) synthase|nr:alpha-glucan family phosphorylase [Bacteroidota bacterium]
MKLRRPDYIFETSWEVCNKVGGIHAVVASKAQGLEEEYKDNYILLGPDIIHEDFKNMEFLEDPGIFAAWKEQAAKEGLRVKTGRWDVPGKPIAILVDFSETINQKDEIFSNFWELYRLDSLAGQWDYVEPTLFGHTVGRVIESFVKYNCSKNDKILAHFHQWLTGAGILYLKHHLPQVATVLTAHDTVAGRNMAAHNRPLYKFLEQYNGDEIAKEYNVTSKHSLEKISARESDALTTVSEITARECSQFLQKNADFITPNGFNESVVPSKDLLQEKRKTARAELLKVASTLMNENLPEDTFLLGTGGRYEFRNKGIDLLIDSLGKLKEQCTVDKPVVAFMLIPANHYGPRKDLLAKLRGDGEISEGKYLTHNLHDPDWDPILNRIQEAIITNDAADSIKVVFVPAFLNGSDGIFNIPYNDLLCGFDCTAFTSYYEPWGYMPMESAIYGIPAITTSLGGYACWIKEHFNGELKGIQILERNDENNEQVKTRFVNAVCKVLHADDDEKRAIKENALDIAQTVHWSKLIGYYRQANTLALERAEERSELFVNIEEKQTELTQEYIPPQVNEPVWKRVIVQSYLPKELNKLHEITYNLWWTWDDEAQELFDEIDHEIWDECDQNPLILFEMVSYDKLTKLKNDKSYIDKLNRVYKRYQDYINTPYRENSPRIAYFSMEYGLHDFLKIYSGGLGVLAGDYLKEASDARVDMVGVGFLYRYGYFRQMLSIYGEQLVSYDYQHFSKLPITPFKNSKGEFITISVAFPGRNVQVRLWEVKIGRISLILLDTDFDANREEDRYISHHLYGGDNENRLKQEIVIGIGGIRALQALGIEPDLYHSNEGHSAFIGFERLRSFISDHKLSYSEAKEIVRASTLFTTHTPVPAGHDEFEESLVRKYMGHYPARLNISWNEFMSLGRANPNDWNEKFNMSHIACHLAQEVNGVSLLHGQVSREMFAKLWPGYLPEELHLSYVTNGVHYPTWTAKEWKEIYNEYLGPDFPNNQSKKEHWEKIYDVPQKLIWDTKQKMRSKLILVIKERLKVNWVKRHEDPKQIMAINNALSDKVLTIGFARRFATYKRANLLFQNPERLSEIVNNTDRPVQILYAGKAHPKDKEGQALMKRIIEYSKKPEFTGKLLFLQNYDMQLAKHLVKGVDIWLNTPTRPLEASGTSGEKAVMNGGLHFSVLDGWWVEGYQPDAGWALTNERTYENQDFQNDLDAETIYSILETEVTPAFYDQNKEGYSPSWVKFIQNSIANVAPKFTMTRQLNDYFDRFYNKLYERSQKMNANDYALATKLSNWKKNIARNWHEIEIVNIELPEKQTEIIRMGQDYESTVVLKSNDIPPKNIGVEIVITEDAKTFIQKKEYEIDKIENGNIYYKTNITINNPGTFTYGVRVFPKHEELPHRQDIGFLKWI